MCSPDPSWTLRGGGGVFVVDTRVHIVIMLFTCVLAQEQNKCETFSCVLAVLPVKQFLSCYLFFFPRHSRLGWNAENTSNIHPITFRVKLCQHKHKNKEKIQKFHQRPSFQSFPISMGPYPFQPFRCRRSPGLDLPPAVQQQPGLLPGITEATPGEAGLLGSWWDDCCVIWGYPYLWKPPYGNKHWENIGKTFWCLELGTDPNLGTPLNP